MKKRTRKQTLMRAFAAMGLGCALPLSGCATQNLDTVKPLSTITHTESFQVAGHKVIGVKLLKINGKIFAGYFRADNGIVLCPHFDLEAMNKAKIPAAVSPKWATNTLKQGIEEKIIKVNKLAAAKGVKVGMGVRKALELMMR